MNLALINVKFKADLRGFSSEMQTALKTVDKYGKSFTEIGKSLSLYVTAPVIAAGAASIKMASDFNESLNKVDVAFKTSADGVKKFADTTLENFGISEGAALDMSSLFGDMATSMGIPVDAAAKMSTSLVGLAGDLASFKNIGLDQATTALNGVFTGETESLKRIGIVMTEANLAGFALSKGIKTQIKDMTQAEKVNLRYAYVMANTANAQGDFARTSDGAANQTRIFQESLKQIGAEFGQIILPLFTKVVQVINEKIKAFSDLSEGSKKVIVVVAGLAAAIGPLSLVIGGFLQLIPVMASGFAVLSANIVPIVAILGLATSLFIIFSKNTKEAATAQTVLNDAVKKGNALAVQEVSSLDALYKSATNVKLSINDRKKAVDELQALYPSYFANLKDEAILNGKAKTSYDELREAIFNKARASAIDGEIQARANERVKNEIKLREDIAATEAEIQRLRQGSNEIVLQEASAADKTARVTITKAEAIGAQNRLLANQQNALRNFNAENLKADAVLFDAKQEYLKGTGKLQDDENARLGQTVVGLDAIKGALSGLTPGTIAFWEAEIQAQEKVQKSIAKTNTEWDVAEQKILQFRKNIKAIEDPEITIPKPKLPELTYWDNPEMPELDNSLKGLKDQKSYFEGLREQFSYTSDDYAKLTEQINNTQLKIDKIDTSELGLSAENIKATIDEIELRQKQFTEANSVIGEALTSTFTDMANSMVDSLGIADKGFSGFVKSLTGTIVKLISMMLAQAMAGSITGAVQSGTATGPGAVFTTPVFIAEAIAGILSAFAAIPKFQTGGIIGGSNYYGDKVLARVNSGEMILNDRQQKRLYGMINPAVSSGDVAVNLMGGFEIDGMKLRLVLQRADNASKRIGN